MRQFICILSAFALLIGCVKIDPTTTAGQESEAVIAFDCPIVDKKAKSVAEYKIYPDNLNFRVWGYYTEIETNTLTNSQTMYMNGAEFGKDGDTWGSVGKDYYWPNNGYLNFVAYAPASLQIPLTIQQPTIDQGTLQLGKYVVPDAADEDLLLSEVEYACTKPVVEGAGAPLLFHHVLSSVAFKANSAIYGDREDDDPERIDTDLRITRIEILNVRSRGTFSINLQNNSTSWIVPALPTLQKDFVGYDSDGGTGVELTDELQFCHDKQIDPEDEETLSLTNLILLPQQILDDVTLQVTYDMTHTNLKDDGGNQVWIKDQVKTVQVNQCGVTKWLRGHRYIYHISLSLDKIQCTVDDIDWNETELITDFEDLSVGDVVGL